VRFRAQDRGQVLVVFAITATSMLAVVGLLYSFGIVLAQRRSLQTAADAASLSGSWTVLTELASDDRRDGPVLTSIVQFATSNGVPSDGTSADATYISSVYVDATGTALSPSTSVGSGGSFPTTARGVRVTVKNQVPTILPNFLRIWEVLVQDSAASVARPTTSPASATDVIPVGVLLSDAKNAFVGHTAYDLFAHPLAGGQAPTLNFAAAGAPTFGSLATNVQYWSDGQHSGTWQLSQPATVNLADAAYYDSVADGLENNVRRQALVDASGAAYGLVTVPVYDTATSSALHIVGFAQLKLTGASITPTSARGIFVPYPAAAWGTPVAPSTDLGATLIRISS
jgi:Flp pilus assembly protein TadG